MSQDNSDKALEDDFAPLTPSFSSGEEKNETEQIASAYEDLEDDSQSADFDESESAFEEIRNFGENLEQLPDLIIEDEKSSPSLEIKSEISKDNIHLNVNPVPSASDCLLFAQHLPEGFKIKEVLSPLSVIAPLSSPSPLEGAIAQLKAQAQSLSIQALIDWKWQIVENGTQVVMSAVPVRGRIPS